MKHTVTDVTELVGSAGRTSAADHFQRLFELVPALLCVAAPGGRLLNLNLEWERVLGYPREELLKAGLAGLVHPEDVGAALEQLGRPLEGDEARSCEHRCRHQDGSWRLMRWRTTAFEDGTVLAAVTDLGPDEDATPTDRLDQDRAIAEHLPDALFIHDFEGNVLDVNEVACQMFGYRREELVGRHVGQLSPPGNLTQLEENLQGVRARGQERLETVALHRDGTRIPVEIVATRVSSEGSGVVHALLRDISERKLIEAALRESEDRFRTVADKLPLAIYMSSGLEQRSEYINPMFTELFGYTRDEVPSAAEWWPLAYPDDDYRARVMEGWTRAVEQAHATQTPAGPMESVVTCKDGSKRQLLWGHVPLGDKSYAYGLDLTARKQAEARDKLSAEVLGLLNDRPSFSEAVPDIIAAIKRATGADAVGMRMREADDYPYVGQDGFSADFLRTENNLTLRDHAGRAHTDAQGNLHLACTCGLVLSGGTAASRSLFTQGGSLWTEDLPVFLDLPASADPRICPRNRCVHMGYRSFALVPIRTGKEILGLLHLTAYAKGCFTAEQIRLLEGLGMSMGLAVARGRAEDELRAQRDLLHAVSRIAQVGGWELDARTRRLSWTEEVFRLHEVDQDFVPTVGDAIRFYTPEHAPIIRAAVAEALQHGTPFDLTLEIVTARGHRRQVHARGEALLTDGKVTKVCGTFQDLTEKLQIEASLTRMQRLESVGVLAGGIAHDFNNLLTAILGNLALMRTELKADGEGRELLAETQAACETATGLATQLLTFASGGAPVAQVVDLRPVISQASTFAARGTNARCELDTGGEVLAVQADAGQLAQVIQNLVLNAAQAMPEGGEVRVRARLVELDPRALPPLAAGRYVRVTVTDQGSGIAPGLLERIFDPYFSTHGHGRGLGLAVCHSIMTKHGGHIAATSKVGEGSTFTLHLPASDVAVPGLEQVAPSQSTRSGRVLVMDDDPAISKVLTRILVRMGCEVEAVKDGRAALEAYRAAMESARPFEAVILDLTVPGGMGGVETMQRLLALDPAARVVVSSGYSVDAIMSDHEGHGFVAVLPKPYLPETVAKVMRRVLSR